MAATLERVEDVLEINLSGIRGSAFQDALEKVKLIPGRRFSDEECPVCDGEGCDACYKGRRKRWVLEATPENAERVLYSIQPEVSPALRDWIRSARLEQAVELTTPLPDDAELLIPWATERAPWQPEFVMVADEKLEINGLLKHQRPAVDLMAKEGRALLADDMGLGKCVEVISAIEEWRLRNQPDGTLPEGPRLVACPNSVKGTWRREIKLWLGDDAPVVVVTGTTAKARHNQIVKGLESDPNVWIVVNYEQIRATKETTKQQTRTGTIRRRTVESMKEPLLETTPWLAVVADEVHRAKNRKAQATRGLWRIHGEIEFATTGTPVMNRPDELWAPLAWLWPDEYNEHGARHKPGAKAFWTFYEQYTDYAEGYWGKEIIGVKNPDALRFELKGRVIRRTAEILGLPGRLRIPVPVALNTKQRALYAEAEKTLWLQVEQDIKGGDRAAAQFKSEIEAGNSMYLIKGGAVRTVRLRQIIETPATLGGVDDSAVLDACVDKIVDSGGESWVVFCEFKPTVQCLVDRLARLKPSIEAAAYTGDVPTDERSALEDAYQRGDIQVIVGTIDTLYQGITLTAGHRQFWCSRDWNPQINNQGEKRQDRIGQTKRVLVYIAQPEDTVAVSKVEPTNRLKERIAAAILPQETIPEHQEVPTT